MIDLALLLSAFLAGVAAGLLLLLRVAGAREGPNLRADPPTQVAAAARRLTGLYVQAPATPIRPEVKANERPRA
jgi:hypothetical protein